MYRHWAGMEGECGDWSTAATVAEKGLSKDGDDKELLFLAGYARSRYAKVLLGSAQMVGARQELLKAKDYLRRALTPADELLAHGRTLNAKAYRAMVLVCEKLGLAEDVYRFFEMWAEEHPEDKAVRSERDRIVNRFPLLRAVQ